MLTKEKEVKRSGTLQDEDTKEEEKNRVQEEPVVQSQAAEEEIVVQDIKEESTESKIKTDSNKEEVIEEQEKTEDKTLKMSPDEIKTILYNLFLEKGILEETDLENLDNKKQFLIPKGFAYSFLVLSEVAEFCYKCDDFYHANDKGMAWSDPEIGII